MDKWTIYKVNLEFNYINVFNKINIRSKNYDK